MPKITINRILTYWLYAIAWGHILFGIALPFIAYSSSFDFYAGLLQTTFWHGLSVPAQAMQFQRWIIALFGPTIASWGVLMVYLVYSAGRGNSTAPWNTLLIAVAVWAPTDIAISLMHQFWLHVIVDIVSVFIILIPALILRSQVSRSSAIALKE